MKTDTQRKEELIEEIFKFFCNEYERKHANTLREIIDKYLVKHDEDVKIQGVETGVLASIEHLKAVYLTLPKEDTL